MRENIQHVVERCIKADRESQRCFYKMFYGFSMAICTRYSSVHEDVVEIVNDGFLKIFRQLPTFVPRHADYEASLRGWMKTIFVYTAIDHHRRKEVFSTHDHIEVADHETDEESAIDKMSAEEILGLVQKLSPVYRAVFNMYVIDGYRHEEIAEKLNISVGASKSNLFKAKMNIRKMLKHHDIEFYERKAV